MDKIIIIFSKLDAWEGDDNVIAYLLHKKLKELQVIERENQELTKIKTE